MDALFDQQKADEFDFFADIEGPAAANKPSQPSKEQQAPKKATPKAGLLLGGDSDDDDFGFGDFSIEIDEGLMSPKQDDAGNEKPKQANLVGEEQPTLVENPTANKAAPSAPASPIFQFDEDIAGFGSDFEAPAGLDEPSPLQKEQQEQEKKAPTDNNVDHTQQPQQEEDSQSDVSMPSAERHAGMPKSQHNDEVVSTKKQQQKCVEEEEQHQEHPTATTAMEVDNTTTTRAPTTKTTASVPTASISIPPSKTTPTSVAMTPPMFAAAGILSTTPSDALKLDTPSTAGGGTSLGITPPPLNNNPNNSVAMVVEKHVKPTSQPPPAEKQQQQRRPSSHLLNNYKAPPAASGVAGRKAPLGPSRLGTKPVGRGNNENTVGTLHNSSISPSLPPPASKTVEHGQQQPVAAAVQDKVRETLAPAVNNQQPHQQQKRATKLTPVPAAGSGGGGVNNNFRLGNYSLKARSTTVSTGILSSSLAGQKPSSLLGGSGNTASRNNAPSRAALKPLELDDPLLKYEYSGSGVLDGHSAALADIDCHLVKSVTSTAVRLGAQSDTTAQHAEQMRKKIEEMQVDVAILGNRYALDAAESEVHSRLLASAERTALAAFNDLGLNDPAEEEDTMDVDGR